MGAVRICLVYIVDKVEADMHVVLGNWDFPEQKRYRRLDCLRLYMVGLFPIYGIPDVNMVFYPV